MGKESETYNLISDVSKQGPKITWPQLLHLSPKVRRQWTKMVSTRKKATKTINLIRANPDVDVVPLVEAHIKGQRVSKVYVDGGAQMCVMSEKLMHRLGLEVTILSLYRAKLANNTLVKCVGVVKGVRVIVCGVEVAVDMYVM